MSIITTLWRNIFRRYTSQSLLHEFSAVGEDSFAMGGRIAGDRFVIGIGEPECLCVTEGIGKPAWHPDCTVHGTATIAVAESSGLSTELSPFTADEMADAGLTEDEVAELTEAANPASWPTGGLIPYLPYSYREHFAPEDDDDEQPTDHVHRDPADYPRRPVSTLESPMFKMWTNQQLSAMSEQEKVENVIDFIEALSYPLEPWQATALRRIMGGYTNEELWARGNPGLRRGNTSDHVVTDEGKNL